MADYNLPTVTDNDLLLGQGIVFVGPSGATPSVDFGAIKNIRLQLTITKDTLMQGAPQRPVHKFASVNQAFLGFDMHEWDYNRLAYAMGAASTDASTNEVVTFGGLPTVTSVALHLQHKMVQSGNTLNSYIWKAVGEDDIEHAYTDDGRHAIPVRFEALHSATNWAGATLAAGSNLLRIERVL